MAELNPSIILQGQGVNLLGAMDAGMGLAQRKNDMQREREYQNFLAANGAGIMQGDAGALNQLAGYDPQTAMGIQNTRLGMESTRQSMAQSAETMQMRRESARREAEQYAAGLSAAEAQAEAAKIERGVAAGMAAKSPEEWDATMNGLGLSDLVGQFDQRQGIAYSYMGVADALKASKGPQYRPASPEEAAQYGAAAGQFNTESGKFDPINPPRGMSIETGPDGQLRVIEGPGVGGAYPGQNATVTGTARDGGKMSTELSKNDAATIKEMQDMATKAADMESQAGQLAALAPGVGYTGPGGAFLGAVDDIVGFLPGDSGARGAFRSLASNVQLSFADMTKGAISDREMAIFASASPGLSQTPEGNKMISGALVAASRRTQNRANFYEAWARKYGSLEGAQEVWQGYMRDNPIITGGPEGIAIQPEGNWQSYLNRKPAMGYSPQAISGMSAEELAQIPVEQMTPAQLDAIEKRFDQLGAQP